jgi:hypothetical protein
MIGPTQVFSDTKAKRATDAAPLFTVKCSPAAVSRPRFLNSSFALSLCAFEQGGGRAERVGEHRVRGDCGIGISQLHLMRKWADLR